MNIVFFGSSQFAVPALKAILSTRNNLSCIVTQPDRPKGRGLELGITPVKAFAQYNSLKLLQPADINSPETIVQLKAFHPDLFVVVAYGNILSPGVLAVPARFSLNVHASLLPKYRGASPISRAIINGERSTGVTVMRIEEKMDAGPLLLQKEADIYSEDTTVTLENRLSHLGAELLLDAFLRIENNTCRFRPQNERKASYAPLLKKADGLIDWARSSLEIHNLIRGSLPWPGGYTYYHGKLLKLFHARPVSTSVFSRKLFSWSKPGEVIAVANEGIRVSTGQGDLLIDELQLEGGRPMRCREFICGHRIKTAELFTQKKTVA
jgi:methionyl-tRNA formyltransferase